MAVPPTASFTAEPNPVEVGEEVEFDASATTDDGPPLTFGSYRWDLDGDGVFDDAVGPTPTRVYTSAGVVNVGLEVTDSEADVDTEVKAVTVDDPPNKLPVASFRVFPASPTAGKRVDLISTSYDPDGPLASQSWDLDGDGQYDDASGAETSRTFTAGVKTVRLSVRDSRGAVTALRRTIVVAPNLVSPTLLSPFPVIRLVGRLTSRGARIRRLAVAAPAGSSVIVRCSGPRCPRRRLSTTARPNGRALRIKTFERRLRAGVVLQIFVSRPGSIGKYTRFGIRRRKSPSRRDRCLMPGVMLPTPCPGP